MSTGGLFTGNQIVEMAITMEQDGRAFYVSAADSAPSAEVSRLCRRLADEELEHEQTFRAMLDETEGTEAWGESYAGEHAGYIQALLETRALPSAEQGEHLAGESVSGLEALEFALQFEKDTVLFYGEMLGFAKGRYRDTVEGIIAEEKTHVARILGLMQQLS